MKAKYPCMTFEPLGNELRSHRVAWSNPRRHFYALHRLRVHVLLWVRDRYLSRPSWVLEVAVTSGCRMPDPSGGLDFLDQFPGVHRRSVFVLMCKQYTRLSGGARGCV